MLLAGKALIFTACLFTLGALLTAVWLVAAQTWDAVLRWDPNLAALAATAPPVSLLLTALWRTPWCLGPLVLGSLLGTLAAWRWARR